MRVFGFRSPFNLQLVSGIFLLTIVAFALYPGESYGSAYIGVSETNLTTQDQLADESDTPFLARLLNIDPESPPDTVVFLGRFHPLFVHLPISFILLALLVEVLSRIKRFEELKPAASFVLLLGFLSALTASAAGLLLSISGDYGGSTLSWHKWAGISVTVLAGVAYFYKRKMQKNPTPQTARIYGTRSYTFLCHSDCCQSSRRFSNSRDRLFDQLHARANAFLGWHSPARNAQYPNRPYKS